MARFISVAALSVVSLFGWKSCAGFSSDVGAKKHVRPNKSNNPQGEEITTINRRDLLNNLFLRLPIAAAALSTTPPPALALDFDAFESSEISKDTGKANPELTEDEALCKFGAPGRAMGEACERAKMKPNLPGVVDASGKVDRGDYLVCKFEYPVIDDKLVKTRVCKPSKEWPSQIF
mmetsp:Transcript_37626/g.80308  ORF Transcript_37626/g.80308 Transcript_37626/m.80308 type:complete len:177 (+) Transcript_37626:163-693(+)